MKTIKTFFVLVVLTMFLVGCSSLKKHKQSAAAQMHVEQSADSSGVSNTVINQDTDKASKASSTIKEKTQEIEVIGDSLQVIDYDSSGKKTGSKTYKGSGKIKNTTTNKTLDESSTEKSKKSTNNSSKARVSKQSKGDVKTDASGLEVDRKGFSFGDYLFWFFLIFIVLALLYLNNRFKLVSSVFNFIKPKL